jgi:hypothetical protein
VDAEVKNREARRQNSSVNLYTADSAQFLHVHFTLQLFRTNSAFVIICINNSFQAVAIESLTHYDAGRDRSFSLNGSIRRLRAAMRVEFRCVLTQPFQGVNELNLFGSGQDLDQLFHVFSMHVEDRGDEVAAFRRQVNHPNSAIGSALGPGYQALFVKAIDSDANRARGKKDLGTDRVHR